MGLWGGCWVAPGGSACVALCVSLGCPVHFGGLCLHCAGVWAPLGACVSPLSSCWTRNSNMNYWLIIRLPILFAIGVSGGVGVAWVCCGGLGKCVVRRPPATLPSALQVNFLIFVRVICIVVSKLKANLMCKTDIKCRCVTAGSAGRPQPSFRQRRSSRVPSLSRHDLFPPGPHLGPTPCPPPYIWAAPGLGGQRGAGLATTSFPPSSLSQGIGVGG